MKRYILSILTLGIFLVCGQQVLAQHQEDESGHSHTEAMKHEGAVVMTKQHHFEIVPMMHGLAVFAYDYNQNPIDVHDAPGEVTIMLKSGEEHTFKLKSHAMMENEEMDHDVDDGQMGMDDNEMEMSDDDPKDDDHGEMMKHSEEMKNSMLWGAFDLSELGGKKAKVSVKISGLSSEKESTVQFRETINLSNLREQMEMGHDEMNQNDHHTEDEGHMHD